MSNRTTEKIMILWQKNGQKILIFLAILLTSLASYRAGQIAEKKHLSAQINVSLVQPTPAKTEEKINILENLTGQKVSSETALSTIKKTTSATEQQCAFVGSKNSNKYHLPSCRYATNIKNENLRCFASQEEAEKAGYVAASCCVNKK